MARRINYQAQEWEVWSAGMGHGVGMGFVPDITHHQIRFRRVVDGVELVAWIHTADVDNVELSILEAALSDALNKTQKS